MFGIYIRLLTLKSIEKTAFISMANFLGIALLSGAVRNKLNLKESIKRL